ncbi:hypothetical protein ACFZDK_33965 [Streptomyces sp. NPDC007901]|uniref:hypothetical protein n=1 Tax=Streptomyces sp. NPDC007901 TaxID=3364785 RepID=UPI0036EC0074
MAGGSGPGHSDHGGISALTIAADMPLRGYPQRMWIMHVVYPVTALQWDPSAL